MKLHTSKLNDGICDCCDGSDEFQYRGLCENRCEAQGLNMREDAREHHRIVNTGYQIRSTWLKESQARAIEQEQEAQKQQAEMATFEELRMKIDYLTRKEEEKERTMRVMAVRKARQRMRGDRQITAKQIRGDLRQMYNETSSADKHESGRGLHAVMNCKVKVGLVDGSEAEVGLLAFIADALGVTKRKRAEPTKEKNLDPLSKRPVVTKTGKNRLAGRRKGIIRAVLNAKKGDIVGQRLALERLLEVVGLVVLAPPRAAWELAKAAGALLGWGMKQFQGVNAIIGRKGGQPQDSSTITAAAANAGDGTVGSISTFRKVRRQVRQLAAVVGLSSVAEFALALMAGSVPRFLGDGGGQAVYAYSEVYEEGTIQYYLAVMWGAWPEYYAYYFPELNGTIPVYDEKEKLHGHELQVQYSRHSHYTICCRYSTLDTLTIQYAAGTVH
jgi:hypothetical protein